MKNVTAGRPRTITATKLDRIKRMVVERNLSVKKVCSLKKVNVKYGSVIAAVNTLRHSLKKHIKVYAPRTTA
jgi:transposase